MSEGNININGIDYDPASMTDEQNYYIGQIQDLQKKSAQFRFALDQVVVAQDVFTEKLVSSLELKEEE